LIEVGDGVEGTIVVGMAGANVVGRNVPPAGLKVAGANDTGLSVRTGIEDEGSSVPAGLDEIGLKVVGEIGIVGLAVVGTTGTATGLPVGSVPAPTGLAVTFPLLVGSKVNPMLDGV